MGHLVLVRHGETVWHAENRYAGLTDIALTDRGYAQAAALGRWSATAGLTSVWSSSLYRARLTAEPAARASGLPLQIDDRLLELSFGVCEGLTIDEMRRRFPAERDAFERDPARHPLPGGEDPAAAASRGVAALRSIAQATGVGERSLVVAHSTLLRLALGQLLGVDLMRYRTLLPRFANGAFTEIELTPTRFSLLSLNVPNPA